jgi:hypothetical protein
MATNSSDLFIDAQQKTSFPGVYRNMFMRFSVVLLLVVLYCDMQGQSGGFYPEQDTAPEIDLDYIPKVKARIFAGRPGRAALYSLILPGAGQAYNKKYWQVPIVWAGVGTAGGVMLYFNGEYKGYKDAYRERLLAEIEMREPQDKFPKYSTNSLHTYRDRYNRYRQLSIFAFALTWLANSAQAYVGAQLKDFDVSDDLSISIVPLSTDVSFAAPAVLSTSVVLRF